MKITDVTRFDWNRKGMVESDVGYYVHQSAYAKCEAERDAAVILRDGFSKAVDHLEAEVTKLRVELEQERMRLAACGVVAMANTPESAKNARDMHPDYKSASCDDVARMVDENMKLRAALRGYGRHYPECRSLFLIASDPPIVQPCNCGFDAARGAT